MELLRQIHLYVFGPRLLRVHNIDNRSGSRYKPNFMERSGASCLRALRVAYGIGKTFSPIVALFLFRQYKSFFRPTGAVTDSLPKAGGAVDVPAEKPLEKFVVYYGTYAALLLTVVSLAFITRAVGRAMNPAYNTFVNAVLRAASPSCSIADKYKILNRFDFTPYEMPGIYRARPLSTSVRAEMGECADGSFGSNFSLYHVISYVAMHSFGKRMLYPGAVQALQYMFMDELIRGRGALVERHAGQRRRVLTADGNYIDTMFIDRRSGSSAEIGRHVPSDYSLLEDAGERLAEDSANRKADPDAAKQPDTVADVAERVPVGSVKGQFLVICCEGNGGFYEVGLTTTPVTAGYSVLGWNHPGFVESTGSPFPSQEVHAIDAVMQYAVHDLKFPIENIIIYAWSIGGFTACWAAKLYPRIRTLVLDATFDNVVHLARTRFPPSFAGLLEYSIKHYCYLNMDELLDDYSGPVVLIRRLEDEIIVTGAPGDFRYNRCNNLLVKVLKQRFPLVFEHAEQIDDDSEPPRGSAADEKPLSAFNYAVDSTNLDRIGPLRLLRMYLEASPREKQLLLQRFQLTREKARIAADVIRRKRQALNKSDAGQSNNASIFPITEDDLLMTNDGQICSSSQGGMNALKRQLLIGLSDMYMKDVPLSHCMPLPQKIFDQLVPCFDDDVDHEGFFGFKER